MARSRYYQRNILNKKKKAVGEFWVVIHHRKSSIYRWLRSIESDDYSFSHLRKLYLPPVAIVRWIFVKRYYRGQGFGKEAMRQLMDYCSQLGCRYIILEADIDRKQVGNMDLEAWYRRRGFTRIGSCWDGDHAIMLHEVKQVSRAAA